MTNTDITIQTFTIEEYDAVYDLWARCEGVGLSESDSREQIEMFLNRNKGTSFIAYYKDQLAGAVICGHDGRRGYIHHLAVLPENRKQGIGRVLVEKCLKRLQFINILKCHIFIFNSNSEGLKFWESIGWSFRKDIGVVSKSIPQNS